MMRLCLLVVATIACAAATAKPVRSLQGFDRYLEQELRTWQIPGAAVGVIQDGQVRFARGFGVRQIGTTQRVDTRTLFQVGSLSKAFTATALGVLVDEGKVAWDDPVIEHLPAFRLSDPWLTQQVTIRDLLAHRSGISSAVMAVSLMSDKEFVRRARYVQPDAEFRQQALYSNLMYAVAGQVIEAVSGKPWGALVRERLFAPLSMTSSGTSPYEFWDEEFVTPSFFGVPRRPRVTIEDARAPNVAMPHWVVPQEGPRAVAWQSYDNAAAAGSVVSNLDDMLHWLRMHLDQGRFSGDQVVSTASIRELHRPQMLLDDSSNPVWEVLARRESSRRRPAFAMGWRVDTYRGETCINHTGSILGFSAFAAMLPEHGVGVIVLGNSPGVLADAPSSAYTYVVHRLIAFRAFDALLGLKKTSIESELLEFVVGRERDARAEEARLQAGRLADSPPSVALDRYVGDYGNPLLGRIRVERSNEGLTFRVPGAFEARMTHWHGDTFRLVWGGVTLGSTRSFAQFSIDPSGRVVALDAGDVLGGRLRRVAQDE